MLSRLSAEGMSIVPLIGYFDESGHPKDPNIPYFGIGGVVGADGDWARLDRRWREMLVDENLPAIHTHDLLRSKRAFKDKKVWTDARRTVLLERCFAIVGDCLKPRLFGGYFVEFQPGQGRVATEKMYLGCFGKVLKGLEEKLGANRAALDLVLAAQPEVPETQLAERHARWRAQHPRFRGFSTASPGEHTPLQVADLVALLLGVDHGRERGLRPFYDGLFPKGIRSTLDLLQEDC